MVVLVEIEVERERKRRTQPERCGKRFRGKTVLNREDGQNGIDLWERREKDC